MTSVFYCVKLSKLSLKNLFKLFSYELLKFNHKNKYIYVVLVPSMGTDINSLQTFIFIHSIFSIYYVNNIGIFKTSTKKTTTFCSR